ncbi:MAG: chemotaxis protein CheB [Gemmatimonadota bacterium]|jgi:two-component system chemotaxis response regulator CheB
MSSSEPSRPDDKRTSILIVQDDDALRARLVALLDAAPDFVRVADLRSGYEAIRLIHELSPDVVALDLGELGSRAADVLAYVVHEAPRLVVIMADHGRIRDDRALAQVDFGNVEFVVKPADRDVEVLSRRFLAALDAITSAQIGGMRMNRAKRAAARASRAAQRAARAGLFPGGKPATCAVAVAASTGGPRALLQVIPLLPAGLEASVLIVQHMPEVFTSLLADRLDRMSVLEVREATGGELLKAGTVYLARGGRHMGLQRVAAGISITLEDGEPVWGLRPAADLMFAAVARHFGPRSLGVVLTGMGKDGAAGLRAIREVGGWTAVQESETAVLGSMPRAARPWAQAELPLTRLPRALSEQVTKRQKAGA